MTGDKDLQETIDAMTGIIARQSKTIRKMADLMVAYDREREVIKAAETMMFIHAVATLPAPPENTNLADIRREAIKFMERLSSTGKWPVKQSD